MNTLSPERRRLLEQRLKGAAVPATKAQIAHRPQGDRAPLSHAQRQIWWLNEVAPGCPAYNLPVGYRLGGSLDPKALAESLNDVIARHESLRTTFHTEGTEPVQVIHPECGISLTPVTFPEKLPGEREQALQVFATTEATRPFDLAQLPLVRGWLCQMSPLEHVLILVVHHIAADGMSMGLLIQELDFLYRRRLGREAPTIAPLPIQYPDFCVWEHASEHTWATQLRYWEKQLHGPLPFLELPSDAPRPSAQSFAGSNVFFQIPKPLVQQLTLLGRSEGCTFFMTVLAAFGAFIKRYTSAEEAVIGTPITIRPASETAGLIGNFVNMLALRCDLSGDPSLPDLLRRTRNLALDAFSNKDVPFAHLIQRLSFKRDPSRNPLFQAILQVLPETKLRLGDLEIAPFHFDFGFSQFDLALHLYEEKGGYSGRFEYCSDLFERASVERWTGNFVRLLESMAAAPAQRISQLDFLTQTERDRLLIAWNQTRADYPRDKCLHHLIAATGQSAPNAVAVEFEGQRLTYAELGQLTDALAGQLAAAGVGSGCIVPLCVHRSLGMVVGLLGILKAGAAYLPLDPYLPTARLQFMLEDCQARWAVIEPAFANVLAGLEARLIQLAPSGHVIDPVQPASPAAACPEDLAYVIYTSGSTGRPKGVQVCHRSVVNLLTSISQRLELSGADVVLSVATLSFDIATAELLLPLVLGGRVVIVSHEVAADGQRLLAALESSGATFLQPTPATWRLLLAAGWRGTPRLKMVSTGEALPLDLAQELLPKGAALWNLYGPTETTIWSTGAAVTDTSRMISIGRPLANTQAYILDPHLGLAPLGAVGELWLSGDGLARGYLNRPELTAQRFIPHRFDSSPGARLYRTGDLARYLSDGTIQCLGRTDHQVKIRGFRIELGEIESVLRTHPQVRAAAVIPAAPTTIEQPLALVAYVVPQAEPPAPNDLRLFLKSKLPEYMVPAGWVFLQQLPLTPSGKIDRRALPSWSPADRAPESEFVRPRNPVELQLMQVWEQVLGIRPISMRDSFFELGGHSLLAVRLVNEISKSLQCDLRVLTLLQNPTIEELARRIPARRRLRREPAVFTLTEGKGEVPLFFTGAGSWEFSLAGLLENSRPMYAVDVPLGLDVLRAAAANDTAQFPRVEPWAATYTRLIRERVTHGACFLAGHCFNGLLAFEVAHQLQTHGVEVQGVLLLDTWIKAPMRLRRIQRWIAKHLRNTWRQGPGYLHHKTVSKCLAAPSRIRALAQAEPPRPLFFDEAESEVPWALTERVILHAGRRYRPRPLPCPGVLFLAEEGAASFRAEDGPCRAAALFPAGLDLIEVPGGHVTIFDEPHRQRLAAEFQAALGKF